MMVKFWVTMFPASFGGLIVGIFVSALYLRWRYNKMLDKEFDEAEKLWKVTK